MDKIRLNKYLANSGVCSRREADKLIEAGLVKVNGIVITEMGVKIDPEKDVVDLNDEVKKISDEKSYIALNKPRGYTTACKETKADPNIVLDLIDIKDRVYPVGRLDKDTEGLLILTNDGLLAFHLTHPSFDHEKEYLVKVEGLMTNGVIKKLECGVKLDGEKTKKTIVRKEDSSSFYITLTEGKNRQIRRICKKVGCPVKTLKRVRVGSYLIGDLGLGKWKYLTKEEVDKLKGL